MISNNILLFIIVILTILNLSVEGSIASYKSWSPTFFELKFQSFSYQNVLISLPLPDDVQIDLTESAFKSGPYWYTISHGYTSTARVSVDDGILNISVDNTTPNFNPYKDPFNLEFRFLVSNPDTTKRRIVWPDNTNVTFINGPSVSTAELIDDTGPFDNTPLVNDFKLDINHGNDKIIHLNNIYIKHTNEYISSFRITIFSMNIENPDKQLYDVNNLSYSHCITDNGMNVKAVRGNGPNIFFFPEKPWAVGSDINISCQAVSWKALLFTESLPRGGIFQLEGKNDLSQVYFPLY